MQAELAPIALFTFKRPQHTERTLQALARNPEFERSPLHIYCDGARRPDEAAAVEATRAVARAWPHPDKQVHEAPDNRGLAASITAGVGDMCAAHGRVIVIEDDLVVAPVLLEFFNCALSQYETDARVMQISGYMHPANLPMSTAEATFLPFISSWGWATWRRAWNHFDPAMAAFDELSASRALRRRFDLDNAYPFFAMLKKQRAGLIDSWAIRWYLSVFMEQGWVLYPRKSLVNNEGFDGSGTHSDALTGRSDLVVEHIQRPPARMPAVGIDDADFEAVKDLLRSQNSFLQRAGRNLRRRFK
jgi:hypothetical protein